jgi:diguanylate cyclase (GGDEF)-like protein
MTTYETDPAVEIPAREERDRLAQSCDTITDIADTIARIAPYLATVNIRVHDIVASQSTRDPLTGLFTRRYLEDSLGREFLRADLRQGSLAVAILSLDHFERFTTQCGRAAANILLQAAARLMKSWIRREDVLCRYGIDEFAFVMLDASAEAARCRAEQLRGAIKKVAWCHNPTLAAPVTFSAGVAAFPEHTAKPASLLRAAEVALRLAALRGRDCVLLAAPRAQAAA